MKGAGGSRTRFRGFADRRPTVRLRRQQCSGPRFQGHVLARNRTWSPTFARSCARPSHSEDNDRIETALRPSPPPGNRTRPCGFEGRRASATPAGNELSALARSRTWSSTFGGSHAVRHTPRALSKPIAGFTVRPRRRSAGAQGFEPCPRVLEARCSPRSTPLKMSVPSSIRRPSREPRGHSGRLNEPPDSLSTPTRTRTRDSSLGPRCDPPLHHRGRERKARDSNPHPPRGGTALAERLGKPYPTTFRCSGPTGNRTRISATPGRRRPVGPWALPSITDSIEWTAGESNPDLRRAMPVSSRWTSSPFEGRNRP